MEDNYPAITPITISSDQKFHLWGNFHMQAGPRSICIEKNQHIKFLIIFSLLDVYIDSKYPYLEGESFAKKYIKLPQENDYDLMLKELYRIARFIRNTLVHSPSSFLVDSATLTINYKHKAKQHYLEMSSDALSYFYTALIMYIKQDMANHSYFLGIMRSRYAKVKAGITNFNDGFNGDLLNPNSSFALQCSQRDIYLQPPYKIENNQLRIVSKLRKPCKNTGVDFYLKLDGKDYLIPKESMQNDLTIDMEQLSSWRYLGTFPHIPEDLIPL